MRRKSPVRNACLPEDRPAFPHGFIRVWSLQSALEDSITPQEVRISDQETGLSGQIITASFREMRSSCREVATSGGATGIRVGKTPLRHGRPGLRIGRSWVRARKLPLRRRLWDFGFGSRDFGPGNRCFGLGNEDAALGAWKAELIMRKAEIGTRNLEHPQDVHCEHRHRARPSGMNSGSEFRVPSRITAFGVPSYALRVPPSAFRVPIGGGVIESGSKGWGSSCLPAHSLSAEARREDERCAEERRAFIDGHPISIPLRFPHPSSAPLR